MRIVIDPARCMGHGQCEMFGPDLFEVGDDGLARPRVVNPPVALTDQAYEAAERCPEAAIVVADDGKEPDR